MAELIQFEVKELPKLVVVGKALRHNMEALMKGDNPIGGFWDKCFGENVFAPLEAQGSRIYDPSYVGIMCDWDRGDGDFSYIVGMMMRPGATVPEGYDTWEIQPTKAAVSWLRGENVGDVCSCAHGATEQAMRERGIAPEGMPWCMELYNCPRFTTPDDQGRITLDYYIPFK